MPKHSITTVDVGQQYGRLTVMSLANLGTHGAPKRYVCRCICGTNLTVPAIQLARGGTRSCGCLWRDQQKSKSESAAKNSVRYRPEYATWVGMNQRCKNPKCKAYPLYGGRGITVCERWRSFDNFLADMGRRPSPTHTLDRYPDQNGNYEPSNCRWATKREQANNTRRNIYVRLDGRKKSVAEWAREYDISEHLIRWRLNQGWDTREALTTPPLPHVIRLTPKDVAWIRQQTKNQTMSIFTMASRLHVSETTIRDAITRKTFKYVD